MRSHGKHNRDVTSNLSLNRDAASRLPLARR
jgi:hypothetical protein